MSDPLPELRGMHIVLREDGEIHIEPYGISDLEASTLLALATYIWQRGLLQEYGLASDEEVKEAGDGEGVE